MRRAYFYGCSTGGQQAFAEMQRYPQDFDGVIAGAPGHNRVRLNAAFLWQYRANHTRTTTRRRSSRRPSSHWSRASVVAACDSIDGLRDGVLDDPRECTWRPETIRCTAAETPECLTAPQVAALEAMYAGARNPRTGEQIYPGWPKGSEAPVVAPSGAVLSGWHGYWGTTQPTRADFWRYWVFENPDWSWWSFDFDRDLATADAKVGRVVDQTQRRPVGLQAAGGKAIVYQGWADPVVSALDVIGYYERLRAREGSQGATDEYFRLFMVPGMTHCARGPGATAFGNQGAESPICDAAARSGGGARPVGRAGRRAGAHHCLSPRRLTGDADTSALPVSTPRRVWRHRQHRRRVEVCMPMTATIRFSHSVPTVP